MLHAKNLIAVTTVAALLAAGVASGAAPRAEGPRFQEDDDKFVLANDYVTVWFHGKKPMLKVFPTGDSNESVAYEFKMRQLVEYRDLDGDGAPSANEVVARLNLEKASDYEVQHVETEDGVVLNLTLAAPVQVGGPLADRDVALPNRDAVVSLVFTIRGADSSVTAANVTVPVPATSVKWDLVVAEWPWVDAADHRLALDTLVAGDVEPAEDGGVASSEVNVDGTRVGAVSWTTQADGVNLDGENVTVPVVAVVAPAAPEKENATDETDRAVNASRVTFTYDAPRLASLVHDPTVGVLAVQGGDAEDVQNLVGSLREAPGVALPLLAVVLVAAAVAFGRRRG